MAEFWPVVFSLAQLASAYTLMKVVDRLDRLLAHKSLPTPVKPSLWRRIKARFTKTATKTQEVPHV